MVHWEFCSAYYLDVKDDNTTNKSSLVNSLFCATTEIVIWFIVLHFL